MRLFRKILCPVDFSDYSRLALHYACTITKENQATLLVYHCIPDLTDALNYMEGNYWGTVMETLSGNARQRMEDLLQEVRPSGMPVITRIGMGHPPTEILRLTQEEGADLIVMGTHGHTGYERYMTGSVTNRVLHKTSVPVLVVSKQKSPVSIQRILCAIQFEPQSPGIVKVGLDLARAYHATIFLLHVTREKGEEKEAFTRLFDFVNSKEKDGCKIEFLVTSGEAGEMILRTIEEKKIDLLVMGHHSRLPLEELFLGSIAKRMVTDSPCPVLVVASSAAREAIPPQPQTMIL